MKWCFHQHFHNHRPNHPTYVNNGVFFCVFLYSQQTPKRYIILYVWLCVCMCNRSSHIEWWRIFSGRQRQLRFTWNEQISHPKHKSGRKKKRGKINAPQPHYIILLKEGYTNNIIYHTYIIYNQINIYLYGKYVCNTCIYL